MNLSRLAVLAVFFMMIMSTFVTVPTYNVGAMEGGCVDYDDTNDNGLYDEGEPCYDDDDGGDGRPPGDGEGCMNYDDTNGNGLYDEGEPCYDDDDGGPEPEATHVTMTMESLDKWTVDYTGEMPVDWSNDMREELAGMCADMMGAASGEITEDCFNSWLEMMNSEDDGQSHDDEFRCPPGMDDETCSTMMECSENDSMNMDCMRAMYIYCYENTDSEMCEDFNNSDDEDDGGQFIWGIIAYEAGHIDATELMEEYMVPEFGDMGLGTFPDGEDGRPVLYDVQTFNADSDGELIIHPEFMVEIITTPDFVCGDEQTVDFSLVNNDIVDCQDGSDEQQYDDEGDEINWFDCHDGSEISMTLVNDDMWDCHDGEDEYQEHHNYWYGEVYLFEGDHSAGLTDFDNIENVAFRTSHQEWKDENKTDINYEDFIKADISAGTWSLVTTGSCHTEWGEDDEENYGLLGYDCHGENGNYTNSGPYSHKLEFGSEYWLVNGSINHESMEMANFPYMDNYGNDEEFVMYQNQSFSVDTDSTVVISSAGWDCYDNDGDDVEDDCYGQFPGLYIYHGEDLITSNQYYHDEDMYCPVDSDDQDYSNCSYAMLKVDLAPGDYTVTTTFGDSANYLNYIDGAYVVIEGEEHDEWGGYMEDNYWDYDDDEPVLVEGSADRKYMPKADQAEYEPECYDDEGNEMDCDDTFGMFAYMFMIAENATHYEAGNLTAEEAANNSVELFYMLVEMGLFDQGDDGQAGGPNGEELDWNTFSYCEWEGADWEDDTMWYCDEDGDEMDFEDYWYYCEHETDPNHMWYCTDDFGQSSDYEFSAGNTYYKDGGRPEVHNNDGHDDDERDEDDNPPLLDGIVGVGGEDVEPLPLALNVVGSLVDNEDTPMMMGASFNLNFEGADESLDVHSVYIPIEDDVPWHIEMILLEGYEVKSCEGCEDLFIEGSNAKFNAKQPVTVMFGKAATTEECDQIVTIGDGGYSFEPAEITIAVGETVCWIWDNTVDTHNVVEIISEFDENLNLTEATVGFESGVPAINVDFRHTFAEDDKTHYYVCEPHATMGMVGKVTVGNGSEDDRIPDALEESGLPNISFVVGALVLVGAASLRRRTH
jgi:plastocyanin